MANKYSRREFIVWSGTAAGVLALPNVTRVALGSPTNSLANNISHERFPQQIYRETRLIQGHLRPYAWTLGDGSQITLRLANGRTKGQAIARIDISSPREISQNYLINEFCSGRPQENIRRTFGNQVAEEVLREIERYSIESA